MADSSAILGEVNSLLLYLSLILLVLLILKHRTSGELLKTSLSVCGG